MVKLPGDNRPFINLAIQIGQQLLHYTFLVDTRSQTSIIKYHIIPNINHYSIGITRLENKISHAQPIKAYILLYIKAPFIHAFYANPILENIIGMDSICQIFNYWWSLKKLKNSKICHLLQVQIDPVILPTLHKLIFTKQHPRKGVHKEISHIIQDLLKEDIIEPTRSNLYNSSIWPVLKPNGEKKNADIWTPLSKDFDLIVLKCKPGALI